MKIQNLAVIFIIIVLPISMVVTVYVQNQIETLELQVSYDFKLKQATADALKAFQLNTVNSSTSDLANSKIRDIEASVNSFFNSMANQFNMVGYNQDILQEYVPAVVYTLYDGYYIYTPFENTIYDKDTSDTAIYQPGDKLYSLKPYIHYSCRYVKGNIDVTITYTLDNCITVEGIIGDEAVYKTGYLLDDAGADGSSYRGVPIKSNETLKERVIAYKTNDEGLSENVGFDAAGNPKYYIYDKENGVKYYKDESDSDSKWFSILTDGLKETDATYDEVNNSAIEYYKNAYEFTEWVYEKLGNLRTSDAVEEDAETSTLKYLTDVYGDDLIFTNSADGTGNIEDPNSLFNQHRLAVIRYTIEKNLSIAIANYNDYTNVQTNFQMPELKEYEWEQIINNVSIISFMQGLSIGGKVYNGYAIVTNTKTEEVVNTDSIYITTNDGYYHRATEKNLEDLTITGAFFNIDFERKSITDGTNTSYFYPQEALASYSSIVTQSDVNWTDNIYEYMAEEVDEEIATMYFTALGRERFSMFRSNPLTTDW